MGVAFAVTATVLISVAIVAVVGYILDRSA
jgi:hypothetical protein